MENEIKCPKCGSSNVKKFEEADDFLSYKGEGEAAKKQKNKIKQKYICLENNCGYKWEKNLL